MLEPNYDNYQPPSQNNKNSNNVPNLGVNDLLGLQPVR